MFPSLFIAHGLPMLALEDHTYSRYIREMGRALPKPEAVVIVTACSEHDAIVIHAGDGFELARDTSGFPNELKDIRYPALGHRIIASDIGIMCEKYGFSYRFDVKNELDFGSWVVLQWMYPLADVPIVYISLNGKLVPEELYRFGQLLNALRRRQRILVVGSGGTVNNLRKLSWDSVEPERWAVAFDNWLMEQVIHWDKETLFQYAERAPHAKAAVPENARAYLAPFFVAMGAADGERIGTRQHQSYMFGALSLSCWSFGELGSDYAVELGRA